MDVDAKESHVELIIDKESQKQDQQIVIFYYKIFAT